MAYLTRKYTLFATTSPRTPLLMIPDLDLLKNAFHGKVWNRENQIKFTDALYALDNKKGKGLKSGQKDLVARDRINRSPKKFGFVRLAPTVELTPAGKLFLDSPRKAEILLRQLLKYQLPSPYHIQGKNGKKFWIKPYLELFRLIRHFGSLTFDEVMLFGLQLTDYHRFDEIVGKVESFRRAKLSHKGKYKKFFNETAKDVILDIFAEEIHKGRTKTRETSDSSLNKFIATKKRNMRDYTDSFFRHLRGTEMVNMSQSGHSVSIIPERKPEVDFFLETLERDPCFEKKELLEEYISYLGNPELPSLFLDDKDKMVNLLKSEFPKFKFDTASDINFLKDLLAHKRAERKSELIEEEIKSLKDQKQYHDIVETFKGIKENRFYDGPLMFEWNTWRAMTMIDGGNIKANLNFDDFGNPLSTATGNTPDIVCDYGDFGLVVELTLSSGQKQFAMESEPVPRHLGRYKDSIGKQTYCLFIAPSINEATIAYFFGLHKNPIDFYGGETIIVPLELKYFEKMLADSYKANYIPSSHHINRFFEKAIEFAEINSGKNGWKLWHDQVKEMAQNWLDI